MAFLRQVGLGGLAACLVLTALPVASQELDPDLVLEQIGDSRVDVDGAVRIRDLKLNAGLASLYLDDGIAFPTTAVAGTAVEIVFLGEGRVHLEPPDEIEAGQLRLFTGGSTLDEAFDKAAFVVPLDAASRVILGGRDPAEPTEDQVEQAREVHRQWKYGKVREHLGVEGTLLMDALGDPLAGGFFAAWFHTEDLDDFYYILEPDRREQVTAGQFVPREMSEEVAERYARQLRKEQRRGSLIGVVRSDIGNWDTWVRSSLQDPGGKPILGDEGFEPTGYTLEVDLADDALELEGTARIDLVATIAGRKFVPVRLGERWSVRDVRDASGKSLYHHHDEGRLLVYLGRAVAAKETLTLEIQYGGQPFVSLEKRIRILADTFGWYPTVGRIDRAPYDVVFRWPMGLSLVSAGERVEGGHSENGRQWERRRQEIPSLGFSFEIGDLEIETVEAGHVTVEIAHREDNELSEGAREEIRDTIRDALAFHEEVLGPYPLDYLTVVTVPRSASQGLLSFVTLSELAMSDLGTLLTQAGISDRRIIIAHELAHQWWGNLVGWQGYRDQWISEALAEYAAQRYGEHRIEWADGRIASGPTTGWYDHLTKTTRSGLKVEAIGPMVLGQRLHSSRGFAYFDVVYRKGAIVLQTLVWYLGEDRFNTVLAEIVKTASNRIVSTDGFFNLAGRIAGTDLGWFAEQYVRGTGLPEIHYDYEFVDQEDGTWVIEGEAHRIEQLVHEYVFVEIADGMLDVRTTPIENPGASGFRVVAPIQILVHDPDRDTAVEPAEPGNRNKKRKKKDASPPGFEEFGNAVMTGRTVIDGSSAPIRLELPHEPRLFWLDRNRQVFARFYSVRRNPKRTHFRQGAAHQSADRPEEAEREYLAALESEFWSGPDYLGLDPRLVEEEEQAMDTEIHLLLARLYTDRGEYSRAREEIDLARESDDHSGGYRFNNRLAVYESRLDLLEGDSERAFKRLKKIDVGLTYMSTEGYMLFVIAARRIERDKAFERAIRILRARDVDVSLLTP